MDTIHLGEFSNPYSDEVEVLRAVITKYSDGNPAVLLECLCTPEDYPDMTGEHWESYATLSVNVPEFAHILNDGEFFAKVYSENEPLEELTNLDLFTDTGKWIPVGPYGCTADVWKLNLPSLA